MGSYKTEKILENFDNIDLTMEEEYACFQKVIEQKKYELYKNLYRNYHLSGLSHAEADNKATKDSLDSKIELSDEETKICILEAKEAKFYRLKANAYYEALKLPKSYPLPSVDEFYKHSLGRMTDLIGEEFKGSKEYDLLKWYFSKDTKFSNCGYSLSKGLLIHGNIGCGKTTMMKAFTKNTYQSYSMVSCRTVADSYKADGMNGIAKYFEVVKNIFPHLYYGHQQLGWCFDDLGTESSKKHYGDNLNVMAEVLLNWYDKIGIGFNKIHITTNLTTAEIEEYYGSRVRSRMREMFNVITFDPSESDKRR